MRCPDAAWGAVRGRDPAGLDRDGLATHVADLAAVRAWVDAAEVAAARRSRELAAEGCCEPPESVLGRRGRRSGRDAKAAAERERACTEMPGLEEALAAGAVSAGHVDAVANATRDLDEMVRDEFAGHVEGLIDQAARCGVDGFGRVCRDLARSLAARHRAASEVEELEQQRQMVTVRRWVDKATGMHHTHFELDPIRHHQLWSAIDTQLRRLRQVDGNRELPFNQLQADAVAAVATHGSATPTDDVDGGRVVDRVPEITVLIGYDRLIGDAAAAGICETDNGTPLPVATVRQMCCDAEILPVVLGGDGEVLDQGRSRRTVTPAQRRALRAMHRSCAHPDCTVGFSQCRIHHIAWWTRDTGPTNIDNLLPLCDRHHHQIHDGGWGLTMTPDRVATWTRPDGTLSHRGTTIDRRPIVRAA